jgi:hypothetical protein
MVVDDDDDDEDVAEVVESKSKRKRKGAPTVPVTNGKAKGKTRATSTVNGHKKDVDLVIIDEPDDEEPPVAKPSSPTKKGKTRASSSFLMEEGEIVEEKAEAEGTRSVSSPELERLRAEREMVRPSVQVVARLLSTVIQYKIKSEELSERMLQLIKVRNTEPEEELAVMKAQYDAATSGARFAIVAHLPFPLTRRL